MPEISLGDAAKRAGMSRPTMWRLVRSGKVSARRNERGAWMLEQSEFARVFPESFEQQNSSPNSSTNRDEKAFERNALQGEIQILHEVVVELRADKVMLNERLDRAEQERQKLLQVIETQAEHGRQLTDQRPRRSWWWRTFRG